MWVVQGNGPCNLFVIERLFFLFFIKDFVFFAALCVLLVVEASEHFGFVFLEILDL